MVDNNGGQPLERQANSLPQGLDARDVVLERIETYSLEKARDQVQINPYQQCDLFLVANIIGEAYVQFNSKDAPKIPIHQIPKIKRKFNEVYLTNEAQADSEFTVLYGGDLEGEPGIDAQALSESRGKCKGY